MKFPGIWKGLSGSESKRVPGGDKMVLAYIEWVSCFIMIRIMV